MNLPSWPVARSSLIVLSLVGEEGRNLATLSDTSAEAPKLSILQKTAYGFGSAAYGVKNNGFDYFLLLFYSQVIGLDARLVGIAITTALVFDAVSDPIIGYWSDNLRSRWGRRHPFMYASVIPVTASYFLLWNPPEDLSQTGLFWYLLILSVSIRTFITAYETPSSALAPELTDKYDERSSLLSFRYYFGWTGGNAMSVLMFFFMFPLMATATIEDGRFNRESYEIMGIIASALIFVSIMLSAVGTHSRIPHLKPPPAQRRITLGRVFKEIFETLSNRSFISLFLASLMGAIATGLSAALAFYFYTYFWEFTSVETGLITIGVFGSAVIGSTLAPLLSKRMGKKKGAIVIGLVAFLGAPLPVTLRLFGVLPDNGEPFVFWFVFITGMIDVGLIICFQILFSSMIADLVEESELQTGRRNEGVFFASVTFIRKCVQGLGLLVQGFLTGAIHRLPFRTAGGSLDELARSFGLGELNLDH